MLIALHSSKNAKKSRKFVFHGPFHQQLSSNRVIIVKAFCPEKVLLYYPDIYRNINTIIGTTHLNVFFYIISNKDSIVNSDSVHVLFMSDWAAFNLKKLRRLAEYFFKNNPRIKFKKDDPIRR
jgi:hypothetical protein